MSSVLSGTGRSRVRTHKAPSHPTPSPPPRSGEGGPDKSVFRSPLSASGRGLGGGVARTDDFPHLGIHTRTSDNNFSTSSGFDM